MKVLQVIDSGGLYGAERVLIALIEALGQHGVVCTLASIAEPGLGEKPVEAEARRRGLAVRRITMQAGPDRQATRQLLHGVKAEGFDLVHTHGYKANSLISGIPGRRRGLPAVATLHGWTATRRWSRMGLYELIERFALRQADAVVAVSEAMVEKWKLKAKYGGRLRVIHNGIPPPVLPPGTEAEREKLRHFIAGRPSVFAAGRLSWEKGFDVLLEAMARLRKSVPDICLVLAGEGRERQALEARSRRLAIDAAVLMPGYLDDARAFMGEFDVIAIPSRTEGLPVLLLEALMAGRPVAATAVGEMPAVIASCDAGTCACPDDPRSLADLLEAKLKDAKDQAESDRRATRAADLYSADTMATAYAELYDQLVKTV